MSQSQGISLSSSISYSHTQTHSISPSFALSLTHFLLPSHIHTLPLRHGLSLCNKVTVFHYLPVFLSHIRRHCISPSFALSCSNTYKLSHSVMVYLYVTKSRYFSISFSLFLRSVSLLLYLSPLWTDVKVLVVELLYTKIFTLGAVGTTQSVQQIVQHWNRASWIICQ